MLNAELSFVHGGARWQALALRQSTIMRILVGSFFFTKKMPTSALMDGRKEITPRRWRPRSKCVSFCGDLFKTGSQKGFWEGGTGKLGCDVVGGLLHLRRKMRRDTPSKGRKELLDVLHLSVARENGKLARIIGGQILWHLCVQVLGSEQLLKGCVFTKVCRLLARAPDLTEKMFKNGSLSGGRRHEGRSDATENS